MRDQAQVYALVLSLRKHFDAAVKSKRRFKTPNVAACFTVAQTLAVIEVVEQKHQRPVERSRILAVKSLRRSAELVAAVGKEFERMADFGGHAGFHTAAGEIDDWLRSTENLIPMLFGDPRDEIVVIAEAAREAWASANDGEYPVSIKSHTSMATFVAAALGEIGIPVKPRTVESVLGRHRRKHAK